MHQNHRAGRGPLRLAAATAAVTVGAALLTAGLVPASQAAVRSLGSPVFRSAAQGPVTGDNCDANGCATTIDLHAQAGSVTVGGTALPVWNFTLPNSSVTGRNPVLVATAGQTLTITVHNDLPAGSPNLALAVPGVDRSVGAGHDPMPDYTGAAPGGSRTYQITPDRPGTYLYQAGHLAAADPGPREAAMGLAGALVVRPANKPNQVLDQDTPGSVFDDEAVLVLSEIDPKFAAAPMSYDLRAFNGTYRLINGKAWPETEVIGTDVGNHLALRYVNAGVGDASMGLLGLKQYVVGQNAYPSYGQALVADTLQAGTTEDVIVAMPATDTQVLLMDSSGRLDTAGKVDASNTNRQLALGGRMAMITTQGNAPATTDTVGPAASNLSLTPNPMPASNPPASVTVSATFTDPAVTVGGTTVGPNQVAQAEFTLDPTLAPGTCATGTPSCGPMTITAPGTTVTATGQIPLAAIPTGKDSPVYVRAKDDQGNWGPTSSAVLHASNWGPKVTAASVTPNPTNRSATVTLTATGDDTAVGGTIARMGYSLTGDCTLTAVGTGDTCVDLPLTTGSGAVRAAQASIGSAALAGLAEGVTTITVKVLDSTGLVGSATVPLTIDVTPPAASVTGVNPATTNGTVGDPVDPTSLRVYGTFTDSVSTVVAAEGFLDNAGTPVNGKGFVMVAKDGAFDSTSEAAYGLIPLSEVTALADGPHTIQVHGKDAAGNWNPAFTSITLTVDKTAPTLTGLAGSQTGVGAVRVTFTAADATTGLAAGQYAVGSGAAVAFTPAAGPNTLNLSGLATGSQTVKVRLQDGAGNWSTWSSVTVQVQQDLIFADTFGTTGSNFSPWTTTGSPTKVNAPTGMTGRAMQTNTNGSTASYVSTPTLTGTAPNAPTDRYLARFLFARNNLASTAGIRIYSLGSLAGTTFTEKAAVWYRVSGTTPQLAVTVNGAATTTGTTWVTLPSGTGANRIRLELVGGSVQLYADAAASTTTTQVGVTLTGVTGTVNQARMGELAGATGSAYFDDYAANRFTRP